MVQAVCVHFAEPLPGAAPNVEQNGYKMSPAPDSEDFGLSKTTETISTVSVSTSSHFRGGTLLYMVRKLWFVFLQTKTGSTHTFVSTL